MRVHSVIHAGLTGLLTLLLLQACTGMQGASSPDRLFRGVATYEKLTPAVRMSPLVTYCQPPVAGSIEYTLRQFPGKAGTDRQVMRVVEMRV